MKRYGLFYSGKFAYAIPLTQIIKILQDAISYDLPRLPGAISGVLLDNDKLVPMFDFVHMFGNIAFQQQQNSNYQVLISTEYGIVSLPSNLSGKIVLASKGNMALPLKNKNICGSTGVFVYENEEFNLLDINYLALEVTQGFWHDLPDTGGARRH